MEDLRKYSYCSVNICLAVFEAVVFAVCLLTGDRLYAMGRCGTYLVLRDGQYWRLLTSVFLHAGLSHLGSNLLVQILMGNIVERNLGHVRYLILFLLSGIERRRFRRHGRSGPSYRKGQKKTAKRLLDAAEGGVRSVLRGLQRI